MTQIPAKHHDRVIYMYEGVKTMWQLANRARRIADFYIKLAEQGAQLQDEVTNGNINYIVPGHDIAVCDEDDDLSKLDCQICY